MAENQCHPSLKDRTYLSSKFHQSMILVDPFNQYKNWSEDNLHHAYLGVINDKLSIRQVAEKYCVPKSTLQDRVCGKGPFGSKSGPTEYTDCEEQELVEFIVSCACQEEATSTSYRKANNEEKNKKL